MTFGVAMLDISCSLRVLQEGQFRVAKPSPVLLLSSVLAHVQGPGGRLERDGKAVSTEADQQCLVFLFVVTGTVAQGTRDSSAVCSRIQNDSDLPTFSCSLSG